MPRWVDVEIRSDQHQRALKALAAAFRPMNFTIDLDVRGTPTQAVISIEGRTELEVVSVLSSAGVAVLDTRQRIADEMRIPRDEGAPVDLPITVKRLELHPGMSAAATLGAAAGVVAGALAGWAGLTLVVGSLTVTLLAIALARWGRGGS